MPSTTGCPKNVDTPIHGQFAGTLLVSKVDLANTRGMRDTIFFSKQDRPLSRSNYCCKSTTLLQLLNSLREILIIWQMHILNLCFSVVSPVIPNQNTKWTNRSCFKHLKQVLQDFVDDFHYILSRSNTQFFCIFEPRNMPPIPIGFYTKIG